MRVCCLFLLIATLSCTDLYERRKGQEIVEDAIRVYGSNKLIGSRVTFTFRDIDYEVSRKADQYQYTRSFSKDSNRIRDVLVNSLDFTRFIDDNKVEVTQENARKYSNSVNSVLYFFQLPLPLNDQAVKKTYRGITLIKGEPYYELKVGFEQEAGGSDYEDVFYYWIHKKSHLLDYMAYSYSTDGGGVRFREAYNRYEVGGILFQDYINFKAPTGTPLSDLPRMYQEGTLEELSRIVNENILVTKLSANEGF